MKRFSLLYFHITLIFLHIFYSDCYYSLPLGIWKRLINNNHILSNRQQTINDRNITITRDSKSSLHFNLKVAIAGGLAGGLSNAIIYPIDTIKTMMQTDIKMSRPSEAFKQLKKKGIGKVYSGFFPSVFGSIPSSAIYFGSYELMKSYLAPKLLLLSNNSKPLLHMCAAATGNIMSSVVFVPKDAVKQQLQAIQTGLIKWTGSSKPSVFGVCENIIRTNGLKGFYPSYRVTLMRNIPSAMIRFTVYEEFREFVKNNLNEKFQPFGYLVAGALSSGLSSAVTTPFDVIKTRISTGILPPGSPILLSIGRLYRTEGIIGIYAGVQARILWSALFGGIGFSCLEYCKRLIDS